MELSVVGARLSALIVVIGATAGCGGAPPTPPPFTPSTSVSSPTSTAPTEPVLPAAAKQPTASGAKAFAEFYWEMGNYAQATGDTDGLRALGASTCVACNAGVDAIDKLYAKGAVIRGGSYTPTVLESVDTSSQVTAYTVTLKLRISPQTIDYPGKRKHESPESISRRVRMVVNYLQRAWIVAHWEGA